MQRKVIHWGSQTNTKRASLSRKPFPPAPGPLLVRGEHSVLPSLLSLSSSGVVLSLCVVAQPLIPPEVSRRERGRGLDVHL